MLVAHLAALRCRPSLYAAQGYGSLFAYCRRALRLSEDVAANRIHAARACLRFPVILDLLASGEVSLSAVRMLRPHLTVENHERVLARARNSSKEDIARLVAELSPRPDVPASIRKLPAPTPPAVDGAASQPTLPPGLQGDEGPGASTSMPAVAVSEPASVPLASSRKVPLIPETGSGSNGRGGGPPELASQECPAQDRRGRPASIAKPGSVVQPLSPGRYKVQFTLGQEGYDLLRRLQTLLRREIPDGDAGVIFERALRHLHEKVEAANFGRPARRRFEKGTLREQREQRGAGNADGRREAAYENRIRPGADPGHPNGSLNGSHARRAPPSRYIPKAVKRAVWYRDRGQCAFVATSGQRCIEKEFLELHDIHPYALRGSATVGNIALRCRRHNAYEAELVFGAPVTAGRSEEASMAGP